MHVIARFISQTAVETRFSGRCPSHAQIAFGVGVARVDQVDRVELNVGVVDRVPALHEGDRIARPCHIANPAFDVMIGGSRCGQNCLGGRRGARPVTCDHVPRAAHRSVQRKIAILTRAHIRLGAPDLGEGNLALHSVVAQRARQVRC